VEGKADVSEKLTNIIGLIVLALGFQSNHKNELEFIKSTSDISCLLLSFNKYAIWSGLPTFQGSILDVTKF